jgi:hypothetical protein
MSSLSQENIEKLCMTGIYRCEPVLTWIELWRRDTPYHCINWTFKVKRWDDGTYYMYDTYWTGCSGLSVELTDENFDKFELLFDLEQVQKISPPDFYDYNEENRWHIALDSGGYQYSKHYFVRKGAKKNKDIQLERLNRELESLKSQVRWKEAEIKRVLEG